MAQAATQRQILLCHVGPEIFGIDIKHIQEVIPPGPIGKVPKAPAFATGILNYHGRVIAIVDLALFFSIEGSAPYDSPLAKIVVMEKEGYNLGFKVDRAEEILKVEGAGKAKEGASSQYVQEVLNIKGNAVNLLDIDKFLKDIEQFFA